MNEEALKALRSWVKESWWIAERNERGGYYELLTRLVDARDGESCTRRRTDTENRRELGGVGRRARRTRDVRGISRARTLIRVHNFRKMLDGIAENG